MESQKHKDWNDQQEIRTWCIDRSIAMSGCGSNKETVIANAQAIYDWVVMPDKDETVIIGIDKTVTAEQINRAVLSAMGYDGTGMSFDSAVEEMKKGKRVARAAWKALRYIRLSYGLLIGRYRSGNEAKVEISEASKKATDWYVLN